MADDSSTSTDIQPIDNAPFARVGTAQPPAEIQPIPLSDGIHFSYIGTGATPEAIAAEKAHGESMLADTYMKQAKAINGPYVPTKPDGTPGDMIYSATSSYPNNAYGRNAAALDHGVGADVSATAARIGSQAASSIAVPWGDPALAGLNALKQETATSRGPLPTLLGMAPPGTGPNLIQRGVGWLVGPGDTEGSGVIPALRSYANAPPEPLDTERVPLLSEQIRSDLGATGTDMPADASVTRRIAEAVASASLTRLAAAGLEGAAANFMRGASPAATQTAAATAAQGAPAAAAAVQNAVNPLWQATKNLGKDIAWSTGGTVGSDIAGRWSGGDPLASYLASMVLGGAVPGRTILSSYLGSGMNKPETRSIVEDYRRWRQPDDPMYPSFQTMASPLWQRVANHLANIPIFGYPLNAAHQATTEFVRNLVQRGASGVAAGGGGVLPPEVTREGIGGLGIAGARDALPRVQQEMNDLFANSGPLMPGTSFNAAPIVAGVRSRLAQEPTTPDLTSAIYGHLGQLTEAAPGHGTQAPTAPAPPGTMNVPMSGPPSAPGAVDVPMTVGREWLANTSRRLGQGPLPSNAVPVVAMKQDAVNAMADRLNQISPGVGDEWVRNRAQYADLRTNVRDPLYEMSGKPRDLSRGIFEPVKEEAAYNYLARSRMSPTALEPMSRYFSPQYWGNMMGQYLSTLGRQPSGDFRADKVAEALGKIGPQVQTQMTGGNAGVAQGQPGGLPPAFEQLHAAANIGTGTSTPVSRHGWGASASTGLGTTAAIAGLAHYLAPIFGAYGAALPASVYGASRFLESTPLKAGMAGESVTPVVTSKVYSALPRQGAIQANEQQRRMKNFYPGGIGPWNW